MTHAELNIVSPCLQEILSQVHWSPVALITVTHCLLISINKHAVTPEFRTLAIALSYTSKCEHVIPCINTCIRELQAELTQMNWFPLTVTQVPTVCGTVKFHYSSVMLLAQYCLPTVKLLILTDCLCNQSVIVVCHCLWMSG